MHSDADETDETSPRTVARPDSAGVSSASDPVTGPPGPGSHPDPRGNTRDSQLSLLRWTEEAGWSSRAPLAPTYAVEAWVRDGPPSHERGRPPDQLD